MSTLPWHCFDRKVHFWVLIRKVLAKLLCTVASRPYLQPLNPNWQCMRWFVAVSYPVWQGWMLQYIAQMMIKVFFSKQYLISNVWCLKFILGLKFYKPVWFLFPFVSGYGNESGWKITFKLIKLEWWSYDSCFLF